MFKTLTLFSFCLIVFLNSCTTKKTVQGRILFDNDSIRNVNFLIPINPLDLHVKYCKLCKRIIYQDSNNKKIILKPKQAKEISFVDGDTIRMLSCKIGTKKRFLKLKIDGKVKLVSLIIPPQIEGGPYFAYWVPEREKDYFKKDNEEEAFYPRFFFFTKDLIRYFSDCPELVQKFKEIFVSSEDFKLIATEYNNCNKK